MSIKKIEGAGKGGGKKGKKRKLKCETPEAPFYTGSGVIQEGTVLQPVAVE